MTSRRVVLRVSREDGCPLYRVGDQMVLQLPGVDTKSSGPVCALSIQKFLAEVDASECENVTSPLGQGHFLCPRTERPVTFDVEAVRERTSAAFPIVDLVRDIAGAVAHLRTIPIFRPLPAHALSKVAQRIKTENFQDGAVVLEKGHPGRAFFIVAGGTVEIVDSVGDHIRGVISQLRPGDCFGEMSILTGTPVAATVVAKGEVQLYSMSKDDFDLLLRENPFMASRFTRLMAQRLVASNFRLVQQGNKSFAGKLAVMALPTVIQVLADSRRSGTLVVDGPGSQVARIGFSEGQLYAAELGPLEGEDALYPTLEWSEGEFAFDASEVPKDDRVQMGVMNLLLEGMRRLDEANRDPADLDSENPAEKLKFSMS